MFQINAWSSRKNHFLLVDHDNNTNNNINVLTLKQIQKLYLLLLLLSATFIVIIYYPRNKNLTISVFIFCFYWCERDIIFSNKIIILLIHDVCINKVSTKFLCVKICIFYLLMSNIYNNNYLLKFFWCLHYVQHI